MNALLILPRLLYGGLVWLANSPKRLLLTYSVLILICGTLYAPLEDETFGDSIWWAVVTASTVGYGDHSPETWQARIMAAILISAMVLLVIPLITAHFASKLIVNNDAFHHEEQEELKENLRVTRALLEELAARQRITSEGSAGPPVAPSDR
ncbi:potassium channel family protein [Actinoplanes sp. NEAU-A12]|uniref:Potassium channel family protein n=1 Tax=Actinoplanes sandaracinus TaxID=3045177 RepID=A0ABT6WU18_9ACTN|nr:potassium channel family protein [Actinoplanes sandaracinus]MDI6103246.1 potassium channel family protein [Actinoplanes sandaracinus]